jgi:hypothetical protein
MDKSFVKKPASDQQLLAKIPGHVRAFPEPSFFVE